MDSTRNSFGRRPHSDTRIHLTGRKPARQKPPPKEILVKRLGELPSRRMKILSDENPCGISRFCQIPASSGAFFLSAFQFSAFQLYPNPPFPRLRFGHPLFHRPSRQKQIPSNYDRGSIRLLPFFCTIKVGQPQAIEHEQLLWCAPADFGALCWAEADLPVLAQILAGIPETHFEAGCGTSNEMNARVRATA